MTPKKVLRKRIAEEAFSWPELRSELADAATAIRGDATPTASEATVASSFERNMYAVLKDIGVAFNPVKEELVDTERHVGKGRVDSRIGGLVIEYKRPARFSTDKQVQDAVEQITEYMVALSEDLPRMLGIVTDGRRCVEIRMEKGLVTNVSPPFKLNAEVLLRISRAAHALELEALTPANLVRDFCGEDSEGVLFETARVLYKILAEGATHKTQMLHSEWEQIFRLGHEDQSQQRRIAERREALGELFGIDISDPQDEYRALFALQTAYAITVKLMAFRLVSELHLGRSLSDFKDQLKADSEAMRVFCEGLEDGELFRKIGIINLLEGDFFSWYADHDQWTSDLHSSIRSLLEVLSRYEETADVFSSLGSIDLFRDLYEASVPQPVRSSFGEFYTPGWLARHVIESTGATGSWRLLDPCSGSGTFLISAIDLIKRQGVDLDADTLLESILHRVVGIDLNPLAVLTARVNYFAHIADLLDAGTTSLVLPVYLGDSSYVPESVQVDGVDCLSYELKTLKDPISVTLPEELAGDPAAFMVLMREFERKVKRQDANAAAEILTDALSAQSKKPEVEKRIQSFADQIVALEKKNWDGIWARIVSNFLITAALGGFDVIAGNPPWIDWKNLPAGYRERIKGLCIERGLFSGDGRTGGINLNVCALISHTAAKNWLKQSGRLAFLMPKELSVQQSYQGWRRLPGDVQRRFSKFVDWSDAGYPFDPVREDFMTFLIEQGAQGGTIPVTTFSLPKGAKTAANEWTSLEEAKSHLVESSRVAGQITPGSTGFTFGDDEEELDGFSLLAGECSYIGREGIEFYPQELQLFRYEGEGPNPGTVLVRNIQARKSKYRIEARTRVLETRYLFPLVKGPQVKPFNHEYDGLIVAFPYDASDPLRPIDQERLESESPLLLDYYREYENVIKAQTGYSDTIRGADPGEFYGLARTGPYSFADVHVAYRDNTKWHAAVVDSAELPWGDRKRLLFQNHAVSICEREDGTFIGAEEAHYICAIFNAPIVRKYIYAASDSRSFKIRPPIYVPPFDASDSRHKELSKLSQQAHRRPHDGEKYSKQIQKIYLAMCLDRDETRTD